VLRRGKQPLKRAVIAQTGLSSQSNEANISVDSMIRLCRFVPTGFGSGQPMSHSLIADAIVAES